jgi:hypothetical protein
VDSVWAWLEGTLPVDRVVSFRPKLISLSHAPARWRQPPPHHRGLGELLPQVCVDPTPRCQQLMVTRFAASLRTDARTTVRSPSKLDHCLTLSDIRLIQHLDSSAHGLVRRWRS